MRDRKSDTAHRTALETKLGRKLLPNEVADHLDEDKSNNTPANLQPMDRGAHTTHHNRHRTLSRLRAAISKNYQGKKLY